MTERDPSAEAPSDLPPDYDAPGQVDYPDPAFGEEEDEPDVETPDEGEPDPDDDEDDVDEEDLDAV